MRWVEAKSEEERQALVEKGMKSAIYNVCWRCGSGGHNHKTLRKVGKTPDGKSVYGCFEHIGLLGQL